MLKNPHRFIKKMVTFAVPNYKTVLGRKISFPHCFRKSVMFGFGFSFLLSRGGGGGGWGGLNRGSTLSRVTQYGVDKICRFS